MHRLVIHCRGMLYMLNWAGSVALFHGKLWALKRQLHCSHTGSCTGSLGGSVCTVTMEENVFDVMVSHILTSYCRATYGHMSFSWKPVLIAVTPNVYLRRSNGEVALHMVKLTFLLPEPNCVMKNLEKLSSCANAQGTKSNKMNLEFLCFPHQ